MLKNILKLAITWFLGIFDLIFLVGIWLDDNKTPFVVSFLIFSGLIFLIWYKKENKQPTTNKTDLQNEPNTTLYQIENILKRYSPNCCYKKAAKHLQTILLEGEKIEGATCGNPYKNSYRKDTYIVTNKRFIDYSFGLFNEGRNEIPIEKISSVCYSKGILSGYVEINDSGHKLIIYNTPKKETQPFMDAINKQINNYKTVKIEYTTTKEVNVADQIEKLAGLYKEGLLTEYEYSVKKKQLLDR